MMSCIMRFIFLTLTVFSTQVRCGTRQPYGLCVLSSVCDLKRDRSSSDEDGELLQQRVKSIKVSNLPDHSEGEQSPKEELKKKYAEYHKAALEIGSNNPQGIQLWCNSRGQPLWRFSFRDPTTQKPIWFYGNPVGREAVKMNVSPAEKVRISHTKLVTLQEECFQDGVKARTGQPLKVEQHFSHHGKVDGIYWDVFLKHWYFKDSTGGIIVCTPPTDIKYLHLSTSEMKIRQSHADAVNQYKEHMKGVFWHGAQQCWYYTDRNKKTVFVKPQDKKYAELSFKGDARQKKITAAYNDAVLMKNADAAVSGKLPASKPPSQPQAS